MGQSIMNFEMIETSEKAAAPKPFDYRAFYNRLVDLREAEIKLPEEMKTLKTETFVKIERAIRERKFQ